MLSLAKLRVGQEAYQLSGVAESLDAYYTGAGEAPGRWVGGGSGLLELDGEVAAGDLRAVLAGLAPGSGGLSPNGDTIRPHAKRVPGFDATFKVPKSASVLYAVSDDPRVQGAVIEAGEHAMREVVGWFEREAVEVQRGSHNMAWVNKKRAELDAAGEDSSSIGPHRLKTGGVVAASFRHRTSRSGDPLLHWHVLVANLAQGSDGKWSAIAHPELYRHARAAGEVFQAAFRAELTRTLGVEWRPGRHVPEIAGIPQSLLDQFSKRRAEIEAWLAATGTATDAAGQQQAVLATRRHKLEREGEPLDAGWKQEAVDAGWGPEQAETLVAQMRPQDPAGIEEVWRLGAVGFDEDGRAVDYERVVTPEEWTAELLRRDLTVTSTTFAERDVTRAVAARLGDGATVATIERMVALVIADPQVLTVDAGDGGRRFTSRQLHDVEERFVATVAERRDEPAVEDGITAGALLVRTTLGSDQAGAVSLLGGSSSPVSVLIGPAGTGKTYTLNTVRDIYEEAEWRVIGAAPSARAGQELTAGAGIPSRTLHALLGDVQRGLETFDGLTLLVVDEAGMADIRTLEEVVTAATSRGGRVLLAGDQHQMPSIGAGGGFAYAADHAGCVAELTVNRRQREQWEQQALRALRDGRISQAVDAYLTHDRVVVTADAVSLIGDAVARLSAAIDAGLRPVMLAGSNELVDKLNAAAIDVLVERGLLPADDGHYGGTRYRIGARIALRRNSQGEQTAAGDTVDVANGQLGTVVTVDAGRLTIRLDRDPDVDVVLDDRYLSRGGQISHGYALTTHRAQGGTWDLSITVGVDGLYKEAAYTDLSRGRAENWLVITDPDLTRLAAEQDPDLDRHDSSLNPDDPAALNEDLVDRLSTSRAKHLAHSIDADIDVVDRLARSQPLTELEDRLLLARQAARIASDQVGDNGQRLTQQSIAASYTARRAVVGLRVKALDRHNIGTIETVDDRAGTVTVGFVSADGTRHATTQLPWHRVDILDDAPAHTLSTDAAATLERFQADIARRVEQWDAAVTALGSYPGEDRHLARAVDQHVAAAAARLAGAQPEWLDWLVGPRSADPVGATAWDAVVADVARWRSRHHIAGEGLGAAPLADSDDRSQWEALTARCATTRGWLMRSDRHEPSWPAPRSHRQLVERRHRLDSILDDAPPDTRGVIDAVRAGRLGLANVDEILNEALGTRAERQHWILEHWPHVVEYAEINDTLTNQTWGPDTEQLLGEIDPDQIGDALAHAITRNEPWLAAALHALDASDAHPLDDTQIDWLSDVAKYRIAHGVTTRDPLGPVPAARAQLGEFDQLLHQLRDVREGLVAERYDLGIEL